MGTDYSGITHAGHIVGDNCNGPGETCLGTEQVNQ